jgi:hypothetical protein
MLWEISVLNKIYKTNAFTRIRSRAHKGKALYVISNDYKFSTAVTELQEGDLVTSASDLELIEKYKTGKMKNYDMLEGLSKNVGLTP